MAGGNLRAKDRLIVALDIPDPDEAFGLVEKLDEIVSFFKIGHVLHLEGGLDFARRLMDLGNKVFLDLKLYDVPETVGRAVRAIAESGVGFTTVHGTARNVAAAIEARGSHELSLLAVSALTSWDASDLKEVYGVDMPMEEFVLQRVEHLVKMGCDGVITSPLEAPAIKKVVPEKTIVVTPGIRLEADTTDDHKRHSEPSMAIRNGADYIVVGRPIIHAPDPTQAALDYIDAIEQGLKDLVGT